jgi:plastocyanin
MRRSHLSHRARGLQALACAAALFSQACGGEQKSATEKAPTAAAAAGPSAVSFSTSPLTPDPGGKVVTVELYSDAVGNYFKPAEVHAKAGDVIRYTLKVGVHNVHFLADSNANRSSYPQSPSDMLQLPGQTLDLAIKMPAGSYYFQCDPHAALGMKGHLIVE